MSWPLWATAVGVLPIALLGVLVLRSRPLTVSAMGAAALATVLAGTVFGLSPAGLGWATVRGVWTGGWILLIVLPALLLFEVLDRSGALEQLSLAVDQLAPTQGRQRVLLAFALPSFLQGAAGFGAPIAMAAPLLVRRGMAPVSAVAVCLIGTQWAVTFGSMGSSYFMAEAVARLGADEAREFALRAGVVLAISAVVSGLLVVRRGRRVRGDVWRALAVGAVMAVTLVVVVGFQPALGSTVAGLAGLAACWWLLPARGTTRPRDRDLLAAITPYLVLTGTAAIGFGLPPVRRMLETLPELAPELPGSTAAYGYVTTAGAVTPGLRPLLHPVVYVLVAAVVAVVVSHRRGWWVAGSGRVVLGRWGRRSGQVAPAILALTVLAAVLTDAGIIAAMADAAVNALGRAFVLLSAPLGTLGTVLTGSTTASNALLAGLQAEVAVALAIAPAILLAGQTAGGNLGNALSPGVTAVGTAAAGATGREGEVLRRNLLDAAVLLIVLVAAVTVQVWLAS